MFTGIVEELGEVVEVQSLPDSARIRIRGPRVTSDATPGASIAVNGVCLTVVDRGSDDFTADVMKETLDRSNLRTVAAGSAVNLERPLRLADRLGGHLVQGHVDGTGRVVSRIPGERWEIVRISLPEGLGRYVVAKGSIAVDGVSLTVARVGTGSGGDDPGGEGPVDTGAVNTGAVNTGAGEDGPVGTAGNWFEVSLIPTTLELTTLGTAAPGDAVNIEVDVLAKYVERLAFAAHREETDR